MKPRVRTLLEHCIEVGIQGGLRRAYKHSDEPSEEAIAEDVEHYIWLMIDESFVFDKDEAQL